MYIQVLHSCTRTNMSVHGSDLSVPFCQILSRWSGFPGPDELRYRLGSTSDVASSKYFDIEATYFRVDTGGTVTARSRFQMTSRVTPARASPSACLKSRLGCPATVTVCRHDLGLAGKQRPELDIDLNPVSPSPETQTVTRTG